MQNDPLADEYDPMAEVDLDVVAEKAAELEGDHDNEREPTEHDEEIEGRALLVENGD